MNPRAVVNRRDSLGQLAADVVHGSAAVALLPRPRVTPTAVPDPPTQPVRVLDIALIPLAGARQVTLLVSGDVGARLALAVLGGKLGLRAGAECDTSAPFREQVIELTDTEVFKSGRRTWLACPGLRGRPCGSRRRKLYLPPASSYFACSECHGIDVPHAPGRPLRWRGACIPREVLRWREPWSPTI